jgi:hypothetical protein
MDIGSITAALSSLKAAKDITQGFVGLRDEILVQAKVIQLQGLIFDAQSKALDAQAEQSDLAKRVAELEEQLKRVLDQSQLVAKLIRKDELYFLEGDPTPFCPRCVEVAHHSVHLSKTSRIEIRRRVFACPSCKSKFLHWPEG